MPKGGQDDYGALLHEAGHTEHFAHVTRDLPFEYRHLGDNAVTEGFAFIFDHLVLNPRWLDAYLGYTDADDFFRFANVIELYFLRRYAAKLAYETEPSRADGPARRHGHRVQRRSARPCAVEVPPRELPGRRGRRVLRASYLRAWMLEGAFRMMLQDRYGMEWFRDAGPASSLQGSCGRTGQHFTAEQLLLKHGGGKLDTDPLKHHLERALAAERGRRARQGSHQHAAPRAGRRTRRSTCLARCRAAGGRSHGHDHAAAHQARLDVGVRVALGVSERQVAGTRRVERHRRGRGAPTGRRSR